MNMTTEPIRLPALLALVVVLVCAVAISLLLGLDLQVSIAVVLGVLAVVGAPVVAVAESKRARTDSPATVDQRLSELAAGHHLTSLGVELPEDEREGCAHPAEG